MARVNKIVCDRCGRDVGGRDLGQIKLSFAARAKDHDVCNHCIDQFRRFMDNQDVGTGTSYFVTKDECHCHIPCAGPCETKLVRKYA